MDVGYAACSTVCAAAVLAGVCVQVFSYNAAVDVDVEQHLCMHLISLLFGSCKLVTQEGGCSNRHSVKLSMGC